MASAGMDDGESSGDGPGRGRNNVYRPANGSLRYAHRVRGAPAALHVYADDDNFVEDNEEDVVDEGRELLTRLMIKELHKDGSHTETQALIRQYLERSSARAGGVLVQQDQIVDALSRIGDALEADRELNALIFQVSPEASWETFQNVAKRLFADGVSWGRIVALFFFACKMVKRSIDSVPMVSLVLDWVSGIMKTYLATWVLRRGGWRAVMEWFGPKWSQVGMAFGGFCALCLVIWNVHR